MIEELEYSDKVRMATITKIEMKLNELIKRFNEKEGLQNEI